MLDTINLRLPADDAGGYRGQLEVAKRLEGVSEHTYHNNDWAITGHIGGLKVTITERQIKVGDGSLCKWYMGDNYQRMSRGDSQRAIERLSDELHLPMDRAGVFRLDIGMVLILQHPIEVYLNHMGKKRYAHRLLQPNSLYYTQSDKTLCFYDKNREQKSKGEAIPELYIGRNVGRLELRYTNRVARQLNTTKVTGALLYDEAFYMGLLDNLKSEYEAIQKINDVVPNFEAMKTTKELKTMGLLALVEKAGGQLAMLEQIAEAAKCGTLSRKQAYDLRQAINEACKINADIVVPNEAITELDRKVKEGLRFYR